MSRFTDRMKIDSLTQQSDSWKKSWEEGLEQKWGAVRERDEALRELRKLRELWENVPTIAAEENNSLEALRGHADELHQINGMLNQLLDDILLLEPQLKHALDENGGWDTERISRAAEYLRDQAAAQSLGYTDQQPTPAPPTPPRPRFVVIQGGAA